VVGNNHSSGTRRTLTGWKEGMNKTPGFNTRISIAFTADKNGKPIAYYWSSLAMRWIRIGYDKAKMLVSTGGADQVDYVR
jgi:hypothetical protein